MSNILNDKDTNIINNLIQSALAILIIDGDESDEANNLKKKLLASIRFNCNNLNELYSKYKTEDLPKKSQITEILRNYAKSLNSELADKNFDDIENVMQIWEPSEIDEPEDLDSNQVDSLESSIEFEPLDTMPDPTYYNSQRSSLDHGIALDPNMDPILFDAKLNAYNRRLQRKKQQEELEERDDLEDNEIYEDDIRELSSEEISALSIPQQIIYLIEITPEIPSLITGFMQIVELKIPKKENCNNKFSNYDDSVKSKIKDFIEKFDQYMALYDFLVLIKVYIENYVSQRMDPNFCDKKKQLYNIITEIVNEYWSGEINDKFDDINHEDFSELAIQLGGKKKKRKSKKNKSHKKKYTKKIHKQVKKSKSHKKKKIYKSNKKSKKNKKK